MERGLYRVVVTINKPPRSKLRGINAKFAEANPPYRSSLQSRLGGTGYSGEGE